MIDNHNICDFSVFDESFEPFNQLGHRDKQVVRQCIQNFSSVVGLVRHNASIPRVLETVAGLSTVIFSKLLTLPGESIKTIDAFALDAIQINSRGTGANFQLSELLNCTIIKGITISYEELAEFYQAQDSTIMLLPHEKILSNLDWFINLNMEDRNYQKVIKLIQSNYLSYSILKNYFSKHSLFVNEIFDGFR